MGTVGGRSIRRAKIIKPVTWCFANHDSNRFQQNACFVGHAPQAVDFNARTANEIPISTPFDHRATAAWYGAGQDRDKPGLFIHCRILHGFCHLTHNLPLDTWPFRLAHKLCRLAYDPSVYCITLSINSS